MNRDNPFDQFADDFRAAIPSVGPPVAAPPSVAPPEMSSPKGNRPTMNPAPNNMINGPPYGMSGGPGAGGPAMNMGADMGLNMGQFNQSMINGMYRGSPPLPMMNGGHSQWNQPPPPGQMGMGKPGDMGNSMALVTSAKQSNPYAGMLGGPPPPQPNQWGQPPPPQQNQWGQPHQMGGPPPPVGPQPGPQGGMYGPGPQGLPPQQPPSRPQPQQAGSLGDIWGDTGSTGGPTQQQLPQQFPGRPPMPDDMSQRSISGSSIPPQQQPYGAPPSPDGQWNQPPGNLGPPSGPASLVTPPNMPPASEPPRSAQPDGGLGGMFDPIAPAPLITAPAPATSTFDDPWASSAPEQSYAIVPSNAPNNDPFGIFGSPAPAPPAPAPTSLVPAPATAPVPTSVPPEDDDIWTQMGFESPPAPEPTPSFPTPQDEPEKPANNEPKHAHQEGELPPGGEWYDARIFTPTLGVMFFKPQELTDSLFLQTKPEIVNGLDERPVVAFIVEGSSARSAGVELGHVLLKVNGIDVKNPKEASRLIKEGPRPLPLLFYVPDTTVVVAEGEHMVKYDTREAGAPPSAKDWKPKYVVIGGIIAQPWMMNMYRSKSEYDIAVIETQARCPVSVKVKQFSLQSARIQNLWQGPQMVKYKNYLHPWKYIVVLPVGRNPVKISSPNLPQLKPVHEGIRRVLMAQQRDRGQGPQVPRAVPVRQQDPYGRNGYTEQDKMYHLDKKLSQRIAIRGF